MKGNHGLDLEEIINLVSKCHEDSKAVASRIETQFSEITLQQPLDEVAVLSFLNDYDTLGEDDYIKAHFESKNSNWHRDVLGS